MDGNLANIWDFDKGIAGRLIGSQVFSADLQSATNRTVQKN